MKAIITLFMLIAGCVAQRGSYAGINPIGFPQIDESKPSASDGLANRFGDTPTTTIRLPVEARGDADLVNRLRKLPIDQQPFWLLNWQAVEANMRNPVNYPQKQFDFIDNIS